MTLQPAQAKDLVRTTWTTILATLRERGLLKERGRQGGYVIPVVDVALVLPNTTAFILDMHRLGGIAVEKWKDPDLARQLTAALQGRRAVAISEGGLAIVVSHRPSEQPRPRALPTEIPLDLEELPEEPYRVRLGLAQRGPVDLDLQTEHRAILVGGTPGSGKTNLFRSVVLQLAAKHEPEDVQIAVVDLKEVDFGPATPFARLPQLFAPIAYTYDESEALLQQLWGEHLRRKARFQAAGVAALEDYNARADEPLPLIVLIVDEAADLVGTAAATFLVQIARKGRATGLTVLAGTQHPTSRVIDSQIKAQLATRIAFQTATASDSRTILDRGGAEGLSTRGRCLLYHAGRWRTVQTLYADGPETLVDEHVVALPQRLSPIENDLVQVALEEFEGAFNINRLYQHPVNAAGEGRHRLSKDKITQLAQTWEQRGWLTAPADVTSPRYVTPTLSRLLDETWWEAEVGAIE